MTVWPVEVGYDVERTVYVQAPTEPEAQRLALDPATWMDAEAPRELMDTVRLVGS